MDERKLTGQEVVWPVLSSDPSDPRAEQDIQRGVVQNDPIDGFMTVALPDGSETRVNRLSVLPVSEIGEVTESISLDDIRTAQAEQSAVRHSFARKLGRFLRNRHNPSQ